MSRHEKPCAALSLLLIFDTELKQLDRDLIDWLRYLQVPFLPIYTKADKLSKNDQFKNAAALDAGLTLRAQDRIVFSSKTGLGVGELRRRVADIVGQASQQTE